MNLFLSGESFLRKFLFNQSNPRDLKGIKKEDKIKNVPMAYNTFEVKINSILG